jgi:hypothetical protein
LRRGEDRSVELAQIPVPDKQRVAEAQYKELAKGNSVFGHHHLEIECLIHEHGGDRKVRVHVSGGFTSLTMRAAQAVRVLRSFPKQ